MCHIRHINPVKIHAERITQKDKELLNDLIYNGIEFSMLDEILVKLKYKITFASMLFAMKINLFNLHFRLKTLKFNRFVAYNRWKQVTLCVQQRFDTFTFNKTRNKNKNTFAKSVYSVLVVKILLRNHKEVCLSINGG